MTRLTPSQQQAIERQKRIVRLFNPDARFTIWQPRNTNEIRLIAEFTVKNMLGEDLQQSRGWSIGKRGKVEET